MSSLEFTRNPTNTYIIISQKSAISVLRTFLSVHPRYPQYIFRHVCVGNISDAARDLPNILRDMQTHEIVDGRYMSDGNALVFDFEVTGESQDDKVEEDEVEEKSSSQDHLKEMEYWSQWLFKMMKKKNATVGVGRYIYIYISVSVLFFSSIISIIFILSVTSITSIRSIRSIISVISFRDICISVCEFRLEKPKKKTLIQSKVPIDRSI